MAAPKSTTKKPAEKPAEPLTPVPLTKRKPPAPNLEKGHVVVVGK